MQILTRFNSFLHIKQSTCLETLIHVIRDDSRIEQMVRRLLNNGMRCAINTSLILTFDNSI